MLVSSGKFSNVSSENKVLNCMAYSINHGCVEYALVLSGFEHAVFEEEL